MAGLLDPKTRVLDTVLTPEGRRQMLDGGIKIKYATVSDIGFDYFGDEDLRYVSGSIPFGMESFSTTNDMIFPVTDASNTLLEFSGDNLFLSKNGAIFVSGTQQSPRLSLDRLSDTVIDSLKKQMIISTLDLARNDAGFSIDPTVVEFSITEDKPFDGEPSITTLTDADGLFCDKRLAKTQNFKFLPPVQKTNETSSKLVSLGTYFNFAETNDVDTYDFLNELNNLEFSSLEFSRLTEYNDIVVQMFETNNDTIKKLDIIKWGRISTSPDGSSSDLYFIGKVYFDEFNVPTFINIFTMVLE
jgi:hypothetical protein